MSRSKEDRIIGLFYELPTKHWHFSDIVKTSNVSERAASVWLRRFTKENLITRTKKKDSMPYFTANFEHPDFYAKKKLYGLKKLYDTGLISYLASSDARTAIIFGSFARGDWHKESDIDIFLYGLKKEIDITRYETLLNKDIQLFTCKDNKSLKRYHKELLRNIVSGDLIKGDIRFLEVKADT